MDVNPITRSLNLPPSPVIPSNTPAAEQVQAQVADAAKVTAPPASGDPAPHGGTSGQPGLGDHVDVYDTEAVKQAAEKNAQSGAPAENSSSLEKAAAAKPEKKMHILGRGSGLPEPADPPTEPEFPFLVPLGSKQPGQVFDAKI